LRKLLFLPLTVLALLAGATASPADVSTLISAGKSDEALLALRQRAQERPADPETYNLLCRVYLQLEDWDNAVRMGERSVTLQPQSSDFHMWLARAYGRKAEFANPFSAFSLARRFRSEMEHAVALNPGNLPARADLAEYYTDAPGIIGGDKNKAREQADFIARTDVAQGHFVRAAIEEDAKTGKAEAEFKAALESSGYLADYWVGLAGFYQRAGRLQEMESAVDRSQTAPHKGSNYLFAGGTLLYQAGRNFPEAIRMLRAYIAAPDHSEDAPVFQAHYFIGKMLEQQSPAEAAEQYRAAVALASEYRPAQDALARLSH